LLAAPSWAGAALATGIFAAFLLRRPLQAACGPARTQDRPALVSALVLLGGGAAAGVLGAGWLGGWAALWPAALAVPGGAFFLAMDLRGDARETAAELAGAGAFALLPAALGTLAGWPGVPALALAALALVRGVPTVLVIRAALRLAKGQPVTAIPALVTSGLGILLVAALWAGHTVQWPALVPAVVLAARAWWLLGSRRPRFAARTLGMIEAALGVVYLLIAALAIRPGPAAQ
jgi:hypothetical protein